VKKWIGQSGSWSGRVNPDVGEFRAIFVRGQVQRSVRSGGRRAATVTATGVLVCFVVVVVAIAKITCFSIIATITIIAIVNFVILFANSYAWWQQRRRWRSHRALQVVHRLLG
jgi:threonine/homoserine/homoserine lactone efflux protein